MTKHDRSREFVPSRPFGSPQLLFHVDNTTLHRLRYVVDSGLTAKANVKLESLNVLHLLETLVLADEIVVSSFESESSQEISDFVIESLSPIRRRDGGPLLEARVHSTWESQLAVAHETAAEIYDRRVLSFDPERDAELVADIDVGAARPASVVEPTARFWRMILRDGVKGDEVLKRAAGEVHLHRTDGLFLFGVAHHPDFRRQVLRSYERFGPWSSEHWNRLHVLFRAVANQRIADRTEGAVYSPPPVRAEILNRVTSLALRRFEETLEELAVSVSQKVAPGTLADYVTGFKVPIPLLGMAALPTGTKSSERLVEKLLAVREETEDLRDRLREMNALYMTGEKDEAFREIEKECREIKRGVAERLGLVDTVNLPSAALDSAVELSQFGNASVPDLRGAAKLLDWMSSLRVRRRKRVRFLANLLARTAEEDGLQIVERLILQRSK